MNSDPDNQINATRLMQEAARGNQQAAEEILPLVYGQLRAIAAQRIKQENRSSQLRLRMGR